MVNKTNESINKVENINSKNISKIKKSFDKKSFESFIKSFGEKRSETIDKISRVMSKNKIKLEKISSMSVDIKNIINYDERDKIDNKIQNVISEIYLSKLWEKWNKNIWFKTIFVSAFEDPKKHNFKGFEFKDISIKISELQEKFPKIVNKINVTNKEIFEKLNDYWFSVNQINEFEKQQPSNQKIISELVFWETKDVVEKNTEKTNKVKQDFENIADIKLNPYCVIEKDIKEIKESKENEKLYDIKNEIDKNQEKLQEDPKNEDIKNEIDENQKKLWEWYLKKISEDKNKREYAEILKKLVENNFNFEQLDQKDKESIVNEITNSKLNEISKNEAIKKLQIDEENLKNFIKKLYDFSKNEDELVFEDKDGNESKIIIKKTFEKWEHKNLKDIEEFEKLDFLPINFEIDLDKSDFNIEQFPELFGKWVNRSWTTAEYQTKNGKVKISNNDMIEIEWIKLSYKDFEDLLNCEKDELKEKIDKYGLWDKVKWDEKNFEEILKKLETKVVSNKIILSWNETNKLIQAYLLANTLDQNQKKLKWEDQTTINEMQKNLDNEKLRWFEDWEKLAESAIEDIENYIYEDADIEEETKDEINEEYKKLDEEGKKAFKEKLKELADKQDNPEISNAADELINYVNLDPKQETESDNNNSIRESQETPKEKFDKARKNLNGNKFLEDKETFGFKKWTRLFINIWWSKLPPKDIDDSFFEFEIINTEDHNFTVKAMWSELESGIEWKTFPLPRTEEQLSKMQNGGKIYKVDKSKKNNRKWAVDNIMNSKIFDKLTVFGEWEWQVTMKNGKIVDHKGEEIYGFWREEDEYIGWKWQTKVYTTYDIKKVDKSKWTVKIACKFLDQNPEKLDQNIEYKYENELTFEKFILLMESKKTRGYTKKQHEERKAIGKMKPKDRSPNKWKFRIFSLASIAWAFKWGFKKIQEAKKKYEEEQKENFENLLYSQEWLDLYSKMGGVFNMFWIFSWITDAFETSKMEYYADRENRTWKKIEKRYKLYESDPHFATLRKEQIGKLLSVPGYIWNDRQRHKMAAAFLFLMKKDGPYGRGLFLKHYGKWFYVEKFLWTEHKKLFEQYRDERKRQLEEYKDINNPHWRKDMQSELNRMEFDYMIWVIDGRQPYGGKWDDEDYQASLWSREFANKLDENKNKYFNENKKRAEDIWKISFRQAEQEYFRMIKAWRIHKALPFLEKMIENAQNKSQENRAKMNFLWAMLTGIIKNGQDEDTMTKFWEIARTIWLLPGIWCRHTDQADKLRILLDWITANPPFEKFSSKTNFKRSDFELWTFDPEQKEMKFLMKDWPNYWEKYGDKILDIIEFKDMESENSIVNLAAKWWENASVYQEIIELSRERTKEDINQKVSYTYWYYEHSPRTVSKWLVDRLIPKNWEYTGKETIEIESAEAFWSSVWQSLNTSKTNNKWNVEFYLWKFFNRFHISVRNQTNISTFARWLSLVKELKEKWHTKEAEYNLWYLIKGMIQDSIWSFPSEFDVVINKFKEFFWNNAEMIDENMMKNTFGDEAEMKFKDKFGMLAWDDFWDKYMSVTTGSTKEKTIYSKKFREYEENYINWEIDRMNKWLKRKGISGMPNPPSSSSVVVKHREWYENKRMAA